MSWLAASFGVLALALALGFAWYERSRPSAGTLALVATLAALAVVGRIAFAPFPNVKPSTDIILLAGYVLGGAPGFVVGAVTALASNLFFGQGPWTPWQMGAWGLCGLLGAGLAVLSRRRLRRVPLALCCGAAGLLFGAIMDFSTWVTFTGQHTLDQYLAISGVSLSFNLAHAIGNVVFCLAFGPALVRSLQRFRDSPGDRMDAAARCLRAAARGRPRRPRLRGRADRRRASGERERADRRGRLPHRRPERRTAASGARWGRPRARSTPPGPPWGSEPPANAAARGSSGPFAATRGASGRRATSNGRSSASAPAVSPPGGCPESSRAARTRTAPSTGS